MHRHSSIAIRAVVGCFLAAVATVAAALTLVVLIALPPIETYFERRAGWPDRHHEDPPEH